MEYDYREAIKEDIRSQLGEYIGGNLDAKTLGDFVIENRDDLEEQLNEELWSNDSVTGNPSGSYTMCTWQAEENLCHNWDLLEEAATAFGYEAKISTGYKYGAEWWDVTIRCYLLYGCISEVLDEIEREGGD